MGMPLLQADVRNDKYVEAKENIDLIKLYEQTKVYNNLDHQLSISFVQCFARDTGGTG